jgi:hypothetical protein
MPWRKTEPMEERMEFCLKALRSGNFRQLCREYGISAKTGYRLCVSPFIGHARRPDHCMTMIMG